MVTNELVKALLGLPQEHGREDNSRQDSQGAVLEDTVSGPNKWHARPRPSLSFVRAADAPGGPEAAPLAPLGCPGLLRDSRGVLDVAKVMIQLQ